MKKSIITGLILFGMFMLTACQDTDKSTVELISTETAVGQLPEVEIVAISDNDMSVEQVGNNRKNVDYDTAEAFEAALNKGENCTGKTVTFIVTEFHPDSAFGYDMWAGEHLNFVSEAKVEAKAGDEVTVKVERVESFLGSWIVYYSR